MSVKTASRNAKYLNSSSLSRPMMMLGAATALLAAGPAYALDANTLPQNPNVAGGSASFSQSGNTLNVNQSTNRAVIDWRSFDIGSNAQTNFAQPNSGSIAVNRVNQSANPTQIQGGLHANGQVWILNPNGVVFGKTAHVDAAGIVASTANIDVNAFMGGSNTLHMTGADHGSVVNEGSISVGASGLAAFVAPSVRNSGTITAKVGKVTLAAGTSYTLDLAGDDLVEIGLGAGNALVDQSGKIVNAGGTVQLSAKAASDVVDSIINVSGVIDASSVSKDGGTIVLAGDNINTAAGAQLSADAGTNGNGGSITSVANKTGSYAGSFSAKGGSVSGDGGQIETSGKTITVSKDVSVNTLAANGKTGNWTLDPDDLDIVAGADEGSISSTASTVNNATIVNQLSTTGVTLAANNSITVDAAIDSSAQSNSSVLALNDQDGGGLTVNLNAAITLGTGQSLTGQGTTVNVGASSLIQNGVDVALDGGATVNVSAGTYADPAVSLTKSGIALVGASGAKITVTTATTNGIDISGDNNSVSGFEIAGPADGTSYLTFAWGNDVTRGIAVHNGATNFAITGNNIHGLRNDVLIDGRNTGSVTGNTIDNSKSGISVQYTDAGTGNTEGYTINISGNSEGTFGNEWGLNTHLNGYYDDATTSTGYHSTISTKIAATATSAVQTALLTNSAANGGWTVQDQGYSNSNRTAVTVSTTGSDTNQGSALKALATVGAGVNAVVTGGTVNVGAGTYAGNVYIDKGLTLAGAGMDATTLTDGINLKNSAFSDLTLKDFTVKGASSNAVVKQGRVTNFTMDGVRVDGEDVADRHGFASGKFDGAISITNSQFVNIRGWSAFDTSTGGALGHLTSVVFSGNLLDNSAGHIVFRQTTPTVGVTISNNIVRNVGDTTDLSSGIFKVFGATTVDFSGNTISDISANGAGHPSTTSGILDGAALIVNGVDTLNVTNNTFTNNQEAILIGDGNALPTTTTLTGNTFTNNAYDIQLAGGTGAGTLVFGAGNNFVSGAQTQQHLLWGGTSNIDMTQVQFDGKLGSAMTNDELFATEDLITDGLDNGTSGFASLKAGNVYVTAASGSIQNGVNAASSGNTVNVQSGNYVVGSQLVIGKNLSIAGESGSKPVITPGADFTGNNAANAWFLVNSGINFNLSNVAFDGSGHNVWQALRSQGNTTVDNVDFRNIAGSVSGQPYRGVAIESFGGTVQGGAGSDSNGAGGSASHLVVTNSTFTNIGREGILIKGDGSTANITGITYTGKGAGDWLDYGIEVGASGQATITGNTITGALGVAASDGSTSAGIMVTSYYGGASHATIENNIVTGNTTSVVVGYDNADVSVVHATNNDFSGNTYGAELTATTATADFSGNWWGSTDAAAIAASMGGAAASSIDFSPFLMSGTDTDGATAGFQGDFSNLAVTTLGGGAADRIGEGVADVSAGGTVNVLAGNYTLPGQLNISKSLTLSGAGVGSTTITSNSTGYGINVTADNTTLSSFTYNGPTSGSYGIKVQPDTGVATDRLLTFAINNVTINGGYRTGLDLNGVNGGTIDNVSVTGIVHGNGIALTDSANVTVTNTTTSNNAWGGLALYQNNGYYDQQVDNITVDGTNAFNEENGIYAQDQSATNDFGAINLSGQGIQYVAKLTTPVLSGDGDYTLFQKTQQGAIDIADAFNTRYAVTDAAVQGYAGTSVDGNNTFYVGTAGGGGKLSINAATAAATSGATINVDAGTYRGQVLIDKNLTLTGAGVGTTTIESPDSLAHSFSASGKDRYAVISVENGANASLSGFTVDGRGQGNANNSFVGIGLHNASGTIDGVRVTRVRDGGEAGSLSGTQHGVAVAVFNDDSTARSVTLENSTIDDFQKNATAFFGPDLTVNVTGNTIIGVGATTVTAQNGIQFSGATGTIDNNTISGIDYSPATWGASSIYLANADNTVVKNNTITGVGTNQGGFGLALTGSANVSVQNNDISDVGYGVVLYDGDGLTITGGSISGTALGIYEAPTATNFSVSGVAFSNNGAQFQGVSSDLPGVVTNNTFDKSVYITGGDTIFSAIQDGVDTATGGDTVNVGAGTYGAFGTSFGGPANLTIQTSAGATIDGTTRPSNNRIVDLRADGTIFTGFTVTSDGGGVGISISGQGVTASGNTITNALTGVQTTTANAIGNNTISGNTINTQYGVSLQNTGNTISGNTVTASAEGVGLLQSANTFSGNTFNVGAAGNALDYYGSATSTGLTASNNTVNIQGGGVQGAVDLAGTNGALNLAAGTYTASSTVSIANSGLTVTGAGAGSTTIDGSGVASNYAIDVAANDVSLNGFTLNGSSDLGGIGVQTAGAPGVTGFQISNVTINNQSGSGLAVVGGSGAKIDNLSVDGSSGGDMGVAIQNSANVTITNTKTSDNDFGLGVYQTGDTTGQQLTGLSVDTTNSFSEDAPVYILDAGTGGQTIGTLSILGFGYAIGNGTDLPNAAVLQTTQQNAINNSVALTTPSDSFVVGWTGTGLSTTFTVGTSTGGTAMSIAAALGQSASANTINVLTGTYGEAVNVTGVRNLNFGTVTLNSLTLGTGAAGSSLSGNIAAGSVALNGATTLSGTTTLNTSATNGNITTSAIDGNQALTLNAGTGAVSLGSLGGTTRLGAVSVTGPATLTGTTYAANSLSLGTVALASDATLDATGAVTTGAVDGAHALTVNAASASLGNLGATTRLGAVSVTGPATLTGTSYNANSLSLGSATLSGDTTLDATGAVTTGAVDGAHALTVNAASASLGNLGATTRLGAVSVTGPATLTGTTYAANSLSLGSATLSGDTTLDATGAVTTGAVDGAHALTVNAASASLGNLGATTRLGAVSVTGPATLTGATYAANSQAYGGSVTLTGNTTMSSVNGGGITVAGNLFGTTNGGQSLTLNAGSGTGALSANGDISLQNVGTSGVRLNNLTVSGNNFSAATVYLAGNFTATLLGNEVFSSQTLNAGGTVNSNVGGNATGPINSGGAVNMNVGGNLAGNINGTAIALNTGSITGSTVTGSTGITANSNTISTSTFNAPTITASANSASGTFTGTTVAVNTTGNLTGNVTGTNVTLNNGSITGSTVTASNSINANANTISTSVFNAPTIAANAGTVQGTLTGDTITLDATQFANVAITGKTVNVDTPAGVVSGTWDTIGTDGSGILVINGETTLGLSGIGPNQLVVEGFALPAGTTLTPSGALVLPTGVLVGLLSPAGASGQPKVVLVHSVQRLGELLANGYTAIVIDLNKKKKEDKEIIVASN